MFLERLTVISSAKKGETNMKDMNKKIKGSKRFTNKKKVKGAK
jgi:hypothetical protein